MDSQKLIGLRLQQHQEVISLVQNDDSLKNTLSSIIETIVACFKTDNKVYFCGNGGSASDAQHLAAEFSGRFYLDRASLPSEALHCNTSYLTAVANDYSYDLIYSRLVSGVGRKGDILVGLSTSGNSKNIVEAFKTAKGKEMLTIALIGEKKEIWKLSATILSMFRVVILHAYKKPIFYWDISFAKWLNRQFLAKNNHGMYHFSRRIRHSITKHCFRFT